MIFYYLIKHTFGSAQGSISAVDDKAAEAQLRGMYEKGQHYIVTSKDGNDKQVQTKIESIELNQS